MFDYPGNKTKYLSSCIMYRSLRIISLNITLIKAGVYLIDFLSPLLYIRLEDLLSLI